MITEQLAALVRKAVLAARDAGDLPLDDTEVQVSLETPRNKQHGDYSSNIALTLKKATGIPDSREIATRILKHLPADSGLIERAEVAGPGFLNFYLNPSWLHDMLVRIEQEDQRYGASNERAGETVLLEFVSANPTGPISVVNGRAAALGDVLGNLLAAQGCTVRREFYINDALNSTQIDKFAETIAVRYMQHLGYPVLMPPRDPSAESVVEPPLAPPEDGRERPPIPFPENGYRGDYMKEIAREILEEFGRAYEHLEQAERARAFRDAALQRCLNMQRSALEAFGIVYDCWFHESSLYENGEVERTLATLKARGFTYEKEGALWLCSTQFGDDKDRVLVRSNEKATYIAADIAYHDNKFRRGHDRLINIWGADHHGYVSRLKAGIAALGYDPNRLEIILTQMVSLLRDGEPVMGGKRHGNVIELKEDMLDEIGKDAARFYFLLSSYENPATVDLELAKKQSNENPVYYVQYAHARLCNILRRAEEAGISVRPAHAVHRALLAHPAELDVLRKLADFPEEVALAARDYAPHRLTRYAMDLAGLLNIFYENCRVLSGQEETVPAELTEARLALVNGARITLRNLLGLLGISAPERM
ncbi:MAG: arginine--tRNA ligase [Chloroherpetonaceae bacterium]|nr:arginine--tRNA ligase [Chthonomonadaceae bacterium]MDW8207161.1 arginine--tRNA ligase [Chloroherpetonaceae bacterium]